MKQSIQRGVKKKKKDCKNWMSVSKQLILI